MTIAKSDLGLKTVFLDYPGDLSFRLGEGNVETWYKMTAMIQGGLAITPVINHQFSYTAFEEAFVLMKTRQAGKIILAW